MRRVHAINVAVEKQ